MIHKNIIIAHDNKFNRGVCEDRALYFDGTQDLQRYMRAIEEDPSKYAHLKHKVYERVIAQYSWESVADQYDILFRTLFENESELVDKRRSDDSELDRIMKRSLYL